MGNDLNKAISYVKESLKHKGIERFKYIIAGVYSICYNGFLLSNGKTPLNG